MNQTELNNRTKNLIHRLSYKYDTISEEYKKKNNLTVEKFNNKEKIVKNEYMNKNKGKKELKSYKTEYFWDKNIHRLIEKRIYTDEVNPNKNVNNNIKYSNNTFNPFVKYKNDFYNNENENNVTKEKIEIDSDSKNPKDSNEIHVNKKMVYSRKYKYLPHLYNANTFNNTNNVSDIKLNDITQENSKPAETIKPTYRVYQKRQIIPPKEEIKENNPQKNRSEIYDKEENIKYTKRPQKKEIEARKKLIFIKKYNETEKNKTQMQAPNTQIQPEKNYKKEEIKYKKVAQPYSSNINITKKKNIRLNMLKGKNDIFKEDEELNNNDNNYRNKNNIYKNYVNYEKSTITYNRNNKTKNDSELIDDLEKIEQYSVNTYLKNDLLAIYGTVNEEFKDFKKDVFNTNLNQFEVKMGEFDKNNNKFIRRKYKYNVKDLCKGKTTTDDIYNKYKKRAIKIERGTYN